MACHKLDGQLFSIDLDALSSLDLPNLRAWLLWWHRRAMLQGHALLLNYDDPTQFDSRKKIVLAEVRKTLTTLLVLSGSERLSEASLPTLDIKPISTAEQKQIWHHLLDETSDTVGTLEPYIGPLVSQFNLNASTIHTICNRTVSTLHAEDLSKPAEFNTLLWQHCRTQARTSLEGLVERIEPKTTWDELVLNAEATNVLHQIVATARNRNKVFSQWKMGGNTERGMGITSMFLGPPGTGKTTAAEIIAHELGLDLYRVDLSQVSD